MPFLAITAAASSSSATTWAVPGIDQRDHADVFQQVVVVYVFLVYIEPVFREVPVSADEKYSLGTGFFEQLQESWVRSTGKFAQVPQPWCSRGD